MVTVSYNCGCNEQARAVLTQTCVFSSHELLQWPLLVNTFTATRSQKITYKWKLLKEKLEKYIESCDIFKRNKTTTDNNSKYISSMYDVNSLSYL